MGPEFQAQVDLFVEYRGWAEWGDLYTNMLTGRGVHSNDVLTAYALQKEVTNVVRYLKVVRVLRIVYGVFWG